MSQKTVIKVRMHTKQTNVQKRSNVLSVRSLNPASNVRNKKGQENQELLVMKATERIRGYCPSASGARWDGNVLESFVRVEKTPVTFDPTESYLLPILVKDLEIEIT
jgi:hypothetical protein